MANTVLLQLPVPTLQAIGAESNGQLIGNITLKLPLPAFALGGGLGIGLTLPAPTLAAQGFTSAVGTAVLPLPVPKLAALGETSLVGNIALTLPAPTLLATGPNTLALVLPVPVFAAAGATGRIGGAQFVLPVPSLAATGEIPFTSSAALVLPSPALAMQGTVGSVANIALALRGIALAADGATGVIGTCTLALPVGGNLQNDYVGGLRATGYQQGEGSITLTLPMLILQATGQADTAQPGEPDGYPYPAVVMHTETGALSRYNNFPFNSMATFNGVYLGASAEGLFVLAGDTDNGTFIDAAARVGTTDFGTSFLKRIDRCYVGYRTSGDLVLRVFTDEINQRDYLITAYGKDGLHGNHTRIGKGLAARYWQFEIRNRNGSDFELNAIELKPTHLRRRIGGGDA